MTPASRPLAVRPSLPVEAMQVLARKVAQALRLGDIITLKGEIGMGKTTFARALIESIAIDAPQVTSPTFNLMQSYDVRLADGKNDTIWHLDLHRLEDAREVEALGLRELSPHIMLIEWPDIIDALMPQERLSILFETGGTDASRTLIFRGSAAWGNRIEKADI